MDALVSVAGNLDPERVLPEAVRRLDEAAGITARSRFWVTPPLGRPEQPDYWNGVVALAWTGTADDLRRLLRRLESDLGRVRGTDKWAARSLDLDVLRCGDWHDPEVLERPWLLRGVLDVDPDAAWPGTGPLARHAWAAWSASEAPWPQPPQRPNHGPPSRPP